MDEDDVVLNTRKLKKPGFRIFLETSELMIFSHRHLTFLKLNPMYKSLVVCNGQT